MGLVHCGICATDLPWVHSWFVVYVRTGLNLSLRPANERRHYKVTPSLIGWAQTQNQPCSHVCIRRKLLPREKGCFIPVKQLILLWPFSGYLNLVPYLPLQCLYWPALHPCVMSQALPLPAIYALSGLSLSSRGCQRQRGHPWRSPPPHHVLMLLLTFQKCLRADPSPAVSRGQRKRQQEPHPGTSGGQMCGARQIETEKAEDASAAWRERVKYGLRGVVVEDIYRTSVGATLWIQVPSDRESSWWIPYWGTRIGYRRGTGKILTVLAAVHHS